MTMALIVALRRGPDRPPESAAAIGSGVLSVALAQPPQISKMKYAPGDAGAHSCFGRLSCDREGRASKSLRRSAAVNHHFTSNRCKF